MSAGMHSLGDLEALAYQVAMGADEAISETPVNRYAQSAALVAQKAAPPRVAPGPVPRPTEETAAEDAIGAARALSGAATTLEELEAALAAFEHCDLKRGARSLVFCDGRPEARVMIIGEAPGRDEDIEGRPFVGRAGKLLDRMLGAIDLGRSATDAERAVYITNILPWRPPQNRDPKPEEIAMMKPFVERHVELVGPDLLVLMGNISCQAMLGRRGITRLRGSWTETLVRPALPMFHPAYLLRNPAAKREAWADLLSLKARLRQSARP
ncbi:uracil-DNA glycosylase [Tropicimonas sp. IMCC6043]|uniref:uracil-DNA glycosylase n=1 Tax=Tropicimonas sp. IMCC6043 TaxID=2510645 RepID=UPI00101DDADA|nr:uracil-DNA glycosylase [Tropicimonas sp. IMCC6043]RYH09457.1 uracil-DNA glycosylase [Tropicimonas sp. IMCC6043]